MRDAMPIESWSVSAGDPDYPQQLAEHPRSSEWATLIGVGRREILRQKCLGLICSVQCPGAVVIKTYDAIRQLRDAGIVVAGGFHSPMERECLEFLLRGKQPVVICPARHVSSGRLPSKWRSALNADRLVIVSPFANEARRTTKALAVKRNEFVAALAAAVLIPHASPGGNAAGAVQRIHEQGQPLFTFRDEGNAWLLAAGTSEFALAQVCSALAADHVSSGMPKGV